MDIPLDWHQDNGTQRASSCGINPSGATGADPLFTGGKKKLKRLAPRMIGLAFLAFHSVFVYKLLASVVSLWCAGEEGFLVWLVMMYVDFPISLLYFAVSAITHSWGALIGIDWLAANLHVPFFFFLVFGGIQYYFWGYFCCRLVYLAAARFLGKSASA